MYERNWSCPKCQFANYASHHKCSRCRATKPEGTDSIVEEALPAGSLAPIPSSAAAAAPGGGHKWRETIDIKTQQLYYYHMETGEVRWDRPVEMGQGPMASGWFGRGSAGGVVEGYLTRNAEYLKRPARKQKAFIEKGKSVLEGANEFNIWYGKYLGDHWSQGKGKEPAESRCVVATDAGYTKADKIDTKSKFFCIHFARGMCARGHECQYFHRIPTVHDDAFAGELHDCFGRERHASHKEDMDGVGSFTNPSRSLYVGGIVKSEYKDQKEVEDALWKHFAEWGEVEHINFVPRISAAFVRYRLRTNCEFAKEAMSNQALDGKETLVVKWAHDDPNPVAKQAVARSNFDAAMVMLQASGASLQPAPFDYPEDYQLPAAKRLKGPDGTEVLVAGTAVEAYPDTDGQFSGGGGGGGGGGGQTVVQTAAPPAEGGEGGEEDPWAPVFDARYQAYYYVHAKTGEVTWTKPGGGGEGSEKGKEKAEEEGKKEEEAAAAVAEEGE